jgi:glycyl-tRNA synthetase beta chain
MFAELLLEIGTEEIPSGYLVNGLMELRGLAEVHFKDDRIDMAGELVTLGTPRRLVLIGRAVADKQQEVVQEVTGPPKSVAYDEDGKPTKAAFGFAVKQGVSVDELGCLKTPRGEYVYVRREIPGRPTGEILAETLPKLIGEITWPKSMRWGRVGFAFVRPIHWVLALFNGEVISFEIAGVKSGDTTQGHRFMAPHVMKVSSAQDYMQKMQQSFVILDGKEREKVVERVAREAAATVGGTPASDGELVTTVANLVEFPSAVCGSFDRAFLKLPDPVLIAAMKEHQKYFASHDDEGKLMPNFVAVNNTVARNESIVRKGHERVLRARLSDAVFFFEEDRKRSLVDRLEDLKKVIYQAELGTSYAKVQRFVKLAEYVGNTIRSGKLEEVRVAARICKCDLVTQIVTEFPTLQGVMGKEYALLEGYPEEICNAIQQHYLPTKAGDQIPTSEVGAIVGLSDRMDTIVGCFAIGLEPSGSADPFALRRHALAIVRIIEEMGWELSLRDFVQKAISILREEIDFENELVFDRVVDFFRERYKQMMLRSGYESDLIEAVISVGFDRIDQLGLMIRDLKGFTSESEEFLALTLTFRRVTNILKKQEKPLEVVDTTLFREPCETALWDTYQSLKGDIYLCLQRKDYGEALNVMARLRRPVDEFFDGVEVLTKDDEALRENRVAILRHLAGLFLSVADFSKFSI